MVNYSGRVDWEFFFGVIIVRCLQNPMSDLAHRTPQTILSTAKLSKSPREANLVAKT